MGESLKAKNLRLMQFTLFLGSGFMILLILLNFDQSFFSQKSTPDTYKNPYVREITGRLHPAYVWSKGNNPQAKTQIQKQRASFNSHRLTMNQKRRNPSRPKGAIIVKKTKLITLAVQSIPTTKNGSPLYPKNPPRSASPKRNPPPFRSSETSDLTGRKNRRQSKSTIQPIRRIQIAQQNDH